MKHNPTGVLMMSFLCCNTLGAFFVEGLVGCMWLESTDVTSTVVGHKTSGFASFGIYLE